MTHDQRPTTNDPGPTTDAVVDSTAEDDEEQWVPHGSGHPELMVEKKAATCQSAGKRDERVELEPKETKDALDAVVDGLTVWEQIMLQDAPEVQVASAEPQQPAVALMMSWGWGGETGLACPRCPGGAPAEPRWYVLR